jgi:hypothetical protein
VLIFARRDGRAPTAAQKRARNQQDVLRLAFPLAANLHGVIHPGVGAEVLFHSLNVFSRSTRRAWSSRALTPIRGLAN